MSSNVIISPNMNLPVPVVSVDPSPDWAQNINACLSTIDGHNHAANSGVQINPDGININTDLPFNGNNAISLRSVRFTPNLTPIALPADIGCLYEAGVDLYYTDGNGVIIRITAGGAVTGATGTITGLPSGTASAAYVALSGTFVFQQATSTAANMDIGTLILRYPGSYPAPTGNYIALEVPSSISSGYSLTLPSIPSQTEVLTLNTSGQIVAQPYDVVGQGMTSVGADPIGVAMTSTGANAVANSRTRSYGSSTEGVGGIASASSSGSFTAISPTSPVMVANQSIQITTSGRPVYVFVAPFGGSDSYVNAYNNSSSAGVIFYIYRNNSPLFSFETITEPGSPVSFPCASIAAIDYVTANTITYQLYVFSAQAGTFVSAFNVSLTVYEL